MLPEGVDDAHCASSLAFLSILEVSKQSKSSMCLDAHLNCHNCIDFQMKSEEVYSPCIIDIPVENGNSILSESYEEGFESCKSGNLLTVSLTHRSSYLVLFKI